MDANNYLRFNLVCLSVLYYVIVNCVYVYSEIEVMNFILVGVFCVID